MNHLKEPNLLIRFFVSVMYAKPEQLGWDPTMRLVTIDRRNLQYDITVSDKDHTEPLVYRTMRLISNVGACTIRGRGTRVWEVQRVGPDGKPDGQSRVLKDSWPDSDRTPEWDIMESIRKDTPQQHVLHRALLTIEARGHVTIGNANDQTMDVGKAEHEASMGAAVSGTN